MKIHNTKYYRYDSINSRRFDTLFTVIIVYKQYTVIQYT